MHKAERPIRIAVILPSLMFGGGIEQHLIKLIRHSDRERFVWSLITLFDHPGRPDLYGEVPGDIAITRLASRGMMSLKTWKDLYAALRTFSPDVVMTSMFSPNTMARILKPFFSYRVITREHNTYDEKRFYHRCIDHVLSYLSDALVAVSDDVAVFASRQALIPKRKFVVINNGVDVGMVNAFLGERKDEVERVRSELGVLPTEKIILNVARLKPTKDHPLLLEAFMRFSKEHPDYRLVIAGDGSDRPAIEERIKELGLGARVHLLGYRKDIFAWFAAADMFVLSSKREGFPNVAIEAMSFGLPLVTTQVAGVGQIIEEGKNGYIVERTPEAMADAMERIATASPDARVAMHHACMVTAARFDITSITKQYESLFERLA